MRVVLRRMLLCFAVLGGSAFAEEGPCDIARPGESLRWTKRKLFVDPNEGCAIADVNGDGVLDVIAGRNWYAGPDYVPRPLREISEFGPDYLETNSDHVFDVNGDGRVDVIAGSFIPTQVYWYENPGEPGLTYGKLWKRHLLVDTKQSSNEITYLHDLDGDGTPEYLVNSWTNNAPMLVWRLVRDEEGRPTLKPARVGDHNGHGMGIGDVNGDGRDDIIFVDGWYEQPAERPFEQPWRLHRDFQLPGASCPILVMDVDGDGRNDLIWGKGHDYGLYWMRQELMSDGTRRWTQHLIDASWSQAHALHLADLTGDGKPELITGKRVRAHSGSDPGAAEPPCLYYYTFDHSTGRFTRHVIDEGEVGTGLQIRTADLNKDGRIDIVVSGKGGAFILFNEGRAER